MPRLAFKMHLRPGAAAEYRRRHDALWPELRTLLHGAGIRDYSIFLDADTDTLFAVQRVEGAVGSQALAEHPVVQRWWAYMADLMAVNDDDSPVSTPLEEVFYLA